MYVDSIKVNLLGNKIQILYSSSLQITIVNEDQYYGNISCQFPQVTIIEARNTIDIYRRMSEIKQTKPAWRGQVMSLNFASIISA